MYCILFSTSCCYFFQVKKSLWKKELMCADNYIGLKRLSDYYSNEIAVEAAIWGASGPRITRILPRNIYSKKRAGQQLKAHSNQIKGKKLPNPVIYFKN